MPPLRHLVFFKFFATSTAEQQNAVRNGLMELPSIIPTLYYKVFPAAHHLYPGHTPLDRGFSLLIDSVFADAKALSVYAPHPAHQGVISQYIAPIREENLVVDFALPASFNVDAWAQLQRPPHVRHIVLFKMKAEFRDEAASLRQKLEQLQASVPGIVSVVSGEQRLSDLYEGYADRSQGLVHAVDFTLRDGAALGEYMTHPLHEKLKEELSLKVDGLFTLDYQPA